MKAFFLFFPFVFFSCSDLGKGHLLQNDSLSIYEKIGDAYNRCVLLKGGTCPYELHVFLGSRLLKESEGQRILIIDSEREPAFKSLFFKNKGKVLNLYRLKQDFSGDLEIFRPSILAPRALANIFNLIYEYRNKGGFLKDLEKDFFKLLKLHHKIKSLIPKFPSVPHGEYIFDILSEYNPKAQFVIGPFPEFNNKDFCKIAKNQKKIKFFFEKSAESYLALIRKYKISYVNLSYASTYDSVSKHNKEKCSGYLSDLDLRNYLKGKERFLDILEKGAPEVFFFQALPNQYEASYLNDLGSNSFSSKKRKNFFRVSYWSHFLAYEDQFSDRSLKKLLPLNQRKLWSVADLYLNSGFKDGWDRQVQAGESRPFLEILYYGFYPSTLFHMSNSFATPVALSYFNFLEQKKGFLLQERLFPSQKILDPLLKNEILGLN